MLKTPGLIIELWTQHDQCETCLCRKHLMSQCLSTITDWTQMLNISGCPATSKAWANLRWNITISKIGLCSGGEAHSWGSWDSREAKFFSGDSWEAMLSSGDSGEAMLSSGDAWEATFSSRGSWEAMLSSGDAWEAVFSSRDSWEAGFLHNTLEKLDLFLSALECLLGPSGGCEQSPHCWGCSYPLDDYKR